MVKTQEQIIKRKPKPVTPEELINGADQNQTEKKESGTNKKTHTIRIDPDLWIKYKVFCARNTKTLSDDLENLIKDRLMKNNAL